MNRQKVEEIFYRRKEESIGRKCGVISILDRAQRPEIWD